MAGWYHCTLGSEETNEGEEYGLAGNDNGVMKGLVGFLSVFDAVGKESL